MICGEHIFSGCQTQEKVVAASANTFVVIADDSKQSTYLGEKVSWSYLVSEPLLFY